MISLRLAQMSDGAACASIYAPFAENTVITFEEEAPGPEEFSRRIGVVQNRHCWIMAEDEKGEALGYAYYSSFRERPAYRWVVESSLYLRASAQARGLGTILYRTILDLAAAQGYLRCYGVVTQPNPASDALHAKLGFTKVGLWPQSGYKLGRWLDVALYDRILDSHMEPQNPPKEPQKVETLSGTAISGILNRYRE